MVKIRFLLYLLVLSTFYSLSTLIFELFRDKNLKDHYIDPEAFSSLLNVIKLRNRNRKTQDRGLPFMRRNNLNGGSEITLLKLYHNKEERTKGESNIRDLAPFENERYYIILDSYDHLNSHEQTKENPLKNENNNRGIRVKVNTNKKKRLTVRQHEDLTRSNNIKRNGKTSDLSYLTKKSGIQSAYISKTMTYTSNTNMKKKMRKIKSGAKRRDNISNKIQENKSSKTIGKSKTIRNEQLKKFSKSSKLSTDGTPTNIMLSSTADPLDAKYRDNCQLYQYYGKHLKPLLEKWNEFTRQHNISYFLTAGALFGSYLHGDVIDCDSDLDVLVNSQDLPKLEKLHARRDFRDNQVDDVSRLILQIDWRIEDPVNRRRYDCHNQEADHMRDECSFTEPVGRFFLNGFYIDIFTYTIRGDFLTKLIHNRTLYRDSVFPLAPCKMLDIDSFCPKDSELFLKTHYDAEKFNYLIRHSEDIKYRRQFLLKVKKPIIFPNSLKKFKEIVLTKERMPGNVTIQNRKIK